MADIKNQRNTADGASIDAGGDVSIGDTINVYGVNADRKDIEFVIKFFVGLMALFAIASLVFLVLNPSNYIASFASGGFFVLLALLIVVLIRTKRHSDVQLNR
ncbi:hypothetical protein BTO09_07560 [Gilvibacter sp. SZ-19]|uniref:hypothetical protein n=1 Tax=Gilvibacter sp. SZ-19 TaxID=754429 RepID=UPI000B3BEB57|nr:hypothetical protein [Gilvibacter sp. SZ-19]ARV12217.1 hypothetical protein BTO09_07560 [Gilvibacter sp. SZ-19]